MTRRRRRLGVAVALLALAVVVALLRAGQLGGPPGPPAQVFPHAELRVGVDPSYPPFAVAGADGLFGLEIDLARALGDELGLPVRFVTLGYDGLYDALRVDSVDVLISALVIDPARRNDVQYTRPYFDAGLLLVSPVGTPFGDMTLMPGHALAYEFGSAADAETRRWLRRVQPFERRPYELGRYALDAVRLGEADAALVDAVTARLYLREHPDWPAQSFYVTHNSYAMAVRADRGAVWAAVNNALEALAFDGRLDAIIERWL
jgi:ABC-type amino acid transport substrate-binding protein